MELPCKLADDELQKYGQKLAGLEVQLTALQNSEKERRKIAKAGMDTVSGDIARFSRMLHNREENRDVKVEVIRNFSEKSVTLKRLDTGDVVDHRAMTPDELQSNIADHGAS